MTARCDLGALSLKSEGKKQWTAPKVDFSDLPEKITNSSSRALYVTPKPPMRAGSQDFLRCESRGMG